jgi:hypothetical protein
MSVTDYDNIVKKINTIVEDKGYSIHSRYDEEEGAFMFEIIHGDIVVSYIQMYNDSSRTIKIGQEEIEMSPLISISSLSTMTDYRGKGLALLLISYGICYLKKQSIEQSSDIEYAILDDDSDNNTMIKGNIYNQFGFVYRDTPITDPLDTNKVMPVGPEKQLLIDRNFINNVNKILNDKFPMDYTHSTTMVRKDNPIKSRTRALVSASPYSTHEYNLRPRKTVKGGKKSKKTKPKSKKYKRKRNLTKRR